MIRHRFFGRPYSMLVRCTDWFQSALALVILFDSRKGISYLGKISSGLALVWMQLIRFLRVSSRATLLRPQFRLGWTWDTNLLGARVWLLRLNQVLVGTASDASTAAQPLVWDMPSRVLIPTKR
jgi:hypothetical protein